MTTIIKGHRAISADTALRLAQYFGTSARFWLNLQAAYDLATVAAENGEKIAAVVRPYAG
jgi:addiction module HigA family antidote